MVKYNWKALDLISLTTLSNIITFIQFSIIPLDAVKSEAASDKSKVEDFISMNFGEVAKIFLAPFNLIKEFNKLAAPLRVGLFSTIVFAFINFLYIIFFMNSVYILIFLADLFIPGMFLFGIIFVTKNYEEGRTVGFILIIIGIIYFVLRLLRFFWPYFDRRGWKWHKKCADTITAVFLNRLTRATDHEDLAAYTSEVRYQTKKRDNFIVFELDSFSLKKRLIDLSISIVLFLIPVVLYFVKWETLLKNSYSGNNLHDMVQVLNIITFIFIVGFALRLIINISWFFPRISFKIFKMLKPWAYLSIIFIVGVCLMPILQMVLQSSAVSNKSCEWYHYYDFRSNADSFLQYFREKETDDYCVPCTKISANLPESRCSEICYYDNYTFPLEYKVLSDSQFISEAELTSVYLIPVIILEIFFLAVFLQLLRQIYIIEYDVVKVLPGPTKNPECKFQTLLIYLKSCGLRQFRSYRLANNLYYFSFTQSKLFVLFFASLLPIIPIKELQPYANKILPWLFFIASIIISTTSLFVSPYISVLHNYVNGISYFVCAITSAIVGLHVCEIIRVTPAIGNIIFLVLIATPFVVALITPFFATKDFMLRPIHQDSDQCYSLERIRKWDRTLLRAFKHKKECAENNEKCHLDPSDYEDIYKTEDFIPQFSDDEENPEKNNPKFVDFNLLKVAPIIVQEALMKKSDERTELMKTAAHQLWDRHTIHKLDFDMAASEFRTSAEMLINTIAHNGLYKLLNLSIILSSCCFGWAMSSGIVQWKRTLGPNVEEYYIRCNMNANFTYPAYGTY